jgi:hypothetical protein
MGAAAKPVFVAPQCSRRFAEPPQMPRFVKLPVNYQTFRTLLQRK